MLGLLGQEIAPSRPWDPKLHISPTKRKQPWDRRAGVRSQKLSNDEVNSLD